MSTLTDQNFEQEVLQSRIPVLVDFWAPWCGPCRTICSTIDELAKEYEGKVKVGKLNVDDNPAAASKYSIMSIPSLLIFHNGNLVKTMVGVQNKENLKREIGEILDKS